MSILHKTLSGPSLCMHLKKGLPPLTSSKVVFRTFLVTLMQIRQSYSSWITDCQHDFEKGKHLQNTFKQTLKFPSSVYDGAIPEKKNKRGLRTCFFEKPPGSFRFFTSGNSRRNKVSPPRNSTKLHYTP